MPLVVVTCGARKAARPTAAAEMYVGGYARQCLRAARVLAVDPDIRIVSARYGLLALDEEIEPYETRLGTAKAITAEQLHAQAAAAGLLARPVTIFAGAAYTDLARQVWPQLRAPLAGLPGIGAHLAHLAEIIRTEGANLGPQDAYI
ncbi:DUF6884 domain-containing protein [Nocardia sp. NPDC004582]